MKLAIVLWLALALAGLAYGAVQLIRTGGNVPCPIDNADCPGVRR